MPDLRRLVDRITEVLGPDATPERVEALATLLLDELTSEARPASTRSLSDSPLRASEPGERAIVTAYGLDQPGILSAITNVVSDAGCNILDVSQKILQGYFTLIMLVDVTPMHGSIQDLQRQLSALGDRLGVRAIVQHEDLFNAMHRP